MISPQKSVYSSPHYDADPVWTEDGKDATFFNDIYFHAAHVANASRTLGGHTHMTSILRGRGKVKICPIFDDV